MLVSKVYIRYTRRMIKAFFFDLDGTLVDTHHANYLAYRQAILNVTGFSADERLRKFIEDGRSSDDFLPAVVPGVSSETVNEINIEKRDTYKQFVSQSIPNTYLIDFLKSMSKEYITALVTTAKQKNAELVLRAHGLEEYFSFCIFGDDVKNMKPSPEAYQLAIERANVLPEEALVFEDSNRGIEAAEALKGLNVIRIRDFS